MDARELPPQQSVGLRRLTRVAAVVLAALLMLAVWSGYGALLSGGHVR